MKIVIFGPPGSGKGTYASRLQMKLGIPTIAAGDIFREMAEADTAQGRRIREYIGRGELIPDTIVLKHAWQVFKDRLSGNDCHSGFILDGYPRTLKQATTLQEFVKIDAVVHLVVPEWVTIERLSSRRICRNCGEVYNLRFLKPEKEGICDKCGGELYQRTDDTPQVIKERLRIYEKQTQPIIEYYTGRIPFVEFKCADIDVPPEVAVREILRGLKQLSLT